MVKYVQLYMCNICKKKGKNMYQIYPNVYKQLNTEGYFTFDEVNLFCEKNKNVFTKLNDLFKVNLVSLEKANIKYLEKADLEEQEYEIFIKPDTIEVYASSEVGMYYASTTLKQILVNKQVQCGYINDKPDLKVRGFMYDVAFERLTKVNAIYVL